MEIDRVDRKCSRTVPGQEKGLASGCSLMMDFPPPNSRVSVDQESGGQGLQAAGNLGHDSDFKWGKDLPCQRQTELLAVVLKDGKSNLDFF